MKDLCKVCNVNLGTKSTIFAAYGELYCSETCGLKAVPDFEDVKEELNPIDIGILT